MKTFNHVAGGVVFTGIFCSFSDINIFENFGTITATVIFSVLPDIDHTRSLIGKSVFPVAKYLQKSFGHRTITHSLAALLLVAIILSFVRYFTGFDLVMIGTASYFSHLIFDMCTRQGIPFFYPFSNRPCVLPANPHMRLQVNDNRSEAIVFIVFLVLNFSVYPLFASGFWSKYNKWFLTFDHLNREMKENPFTYYIITEDTRIHKGILHDVNSSNAVILEGNEFVKIDVREAKLVDYELYKEPYREKVYYSQDIEIDSLNNLIQSTNPVKIQIQSNQTFRYYQGIVLAESKLLDATYSRPLVYPIEFKIDSVNVQLEFIKLQKELVQIEYKEKLEVFNLELKLLKSQIPTDNSSVSRAKRKVLINQISQKRPPKKPDLRIYDLRAKMLKLVIPENQTFNVQIVSFEPSNP